MDSEDEKDKQRILGFEIKLDEHLSNSGQLLITSYNYCLIRVKLRLDSFLSEIILHCAIVLHCTSW